MNEYWGPAIATGITVLVGKIIWDWLAGKRKVNGNGNSGERPVEFWQQKIRETVNEALESKLVTVIANQNRVLAEILDLQKDINTGIVRLVTLEELRTRFDTRQ